MERLQTKYVRDQAGIAQLGALGEWAAPVYYAVSLTSGQTAGDSLAGLRDRRGGLWLAAWVLLHCGGLEKVLGPEINACVLKLHSGLFFLGSEFATLADRILRVRREATGEAPPGASAFLLRLIGVSLVVQAVSDAYAIKSSRSKQKQLEAAWETADVSDESSLMGLPPQCLICLNACNSPTACVCGHVFCWRCITVWIAHKDERCSICRTPCKPQQLIPLNHYAVTPGGAALPWFRPS